MRKNKILPAMVAVGAIVGYRAIKGYGVFNKFRYKNEYEAIAHYLEAHYPNATHGDVSKIDDCFYTTITNENQTIVLTLTKTEDSVYVFEENEM